MSQIDQPSSLFQTQLQLAEEIRTGQTQSSDDEIRRRTAVYQELFFNNLEDFCATTFPVLKSLIEPGKWRHIIRRFFVDHSCSSPHFIEISEEFLVYLSQHVELLDQPYLLELAHYEWVELASSTADENSIDNPSFSFEHIEQYLFSVADATWPLAYSCPVQLLSPENQTIEPEATYIIVYRDVDFTIQFVATDALTVHVMTFMQQESVTFSQCVAFLTGEGINLNEADATHFLKQMLPAFCQRSALLFQRR